MSRLSKWRRKTLGSDRFRVNVDLHFSAHHTEGTGVARNLALRGALIETGTPMAPGDQLNLSLTLENPEDPLEISAAVRWVRGCQVGVEFLKMDTEAFQQLAEYLFGVQHAAEAQRKAA